MHCDGCFTLMEYLQVNQMVAERNSPLFYVIISLLTILDASSDIIYNKGTMKHHFTCVSHGFVSNSEIIKLYLSESSLKIQCFFLFEDGLPSEASQYSFTSAGLAPTLSIINSTYTGTFHFNLTLFSDRVYWLIDIPRENITQNTDVAAVEEWFVRISLQHGLDIYATGGTLLDRIREPILQSSLGISMTPEEISKIHPFVKEVKVVKCPCANDVALLSYILDDQHNGIYLGLTYSGFWDSQGTRWYNLSEAIYAHVGEEHRELKLVDLVLTNQFLVLLTTLGLYVSDLRIPRPLLKFSRIEFCGFEKNDFVKGKLWYSERCFANRELFEVDYVSITFDRNQTLSESSSCFYSKEPFLEWLPCLTHQTKKKKTYSPKIMSFLMDQDQRCGVYLLVRNKFPVVMVSIFKNNKPSTKIKFPFFVFPSSFSEPVGLVFHPRSHFLYIYGNQVWLSMDGGNSFELLANFQYDPIKETAHSFYTSDIVFISKLGNIYRTKAGLGVYEKIGNVKDDVFTLYYDHMGFLHKVTPNSFKAIASYTENFLGKVYSQGFKGTLAAQYLTFNDIIFYAYTAPNESWKDILTKRFTNAHYGKIIRSRKGGTAFIKMILHHGTPIGFYSSAIAEITDPFAVESATVSPCLHSSLHISPVANLPVYQLTLLPAAGVVSSFQNSDIEKTVVIIGYSSFLILQILGAMKAYALPTMPKRVPKNMTFRSGSWHLYDFGRTNGPQWSIYTKPCNYWFQTLNNSLSLTSLKYIDLGESQTLKVRTIPTIRKDLHLSSPQLKIIVGNPHLLHIQSEGYYDETFNYVLKMTVTSRSIRQGSTYVAFVMWEASPRCFVTTVIPTLKSSCSYSKSMHHIPPTYISKKNWIQGVYKDSQGFNLIKTLPINYRPPSNMGIAIPLTDNFYHADPSKSIPRNLFPMSRKLGRFKQCANASNREECNCTDDQKFSYAVEFSDCREKVPRFKFPVTNYPITLEIFNEDHHILVDRPYLVTVSEVNRRGNWKLKHSTPTSIKKLKDYAELIFQVPVYNPAGLNLSIEGSELFHFRVTVIEGITFCDFSEEFQIYVDEVPLPFPGHTLIAIAAAVVLGGLIFIAFMLQIRNIHPWDMFQQLIQRRDVYQPSLEGRVSEVKA